MRALIINASFFTALLVVFGEAGGAGGKMTAPAPTSPSPLDELREHLDAGRITAEAAAMEYLKRIKEQDARIHAVIALNPKALEEARASDARRAAGKTRGPLDGIPILVKDSIDIAGMATTGGSLALKDNISAKSAPLIERLREAGMVVLGKTNLSEWLSYRGHNPLLSGWSAVGGLTRNPRALDRSACGSSSGSAAAVAAGFAPVAIGTDTGGSVVCPSAMTGMVGLRPTVGLISRSGMIPVSPYQDTAGPMAKSVKDLALFLSAMAGSDATDPATREADERRKDYAAVLDAEALTGARIGVVRSWTGYSLPTDKIFKEALTLLREKGAVLVDIFFSFNAGEIMKHAFDTAAPAEFKAGLNAYLARSNEAVKTRTLSEVIAFNRAEPRERVELYGQGGFEKAEMAPALDDPAYLHARKEATRLARLEGIDRLLREHDVAALVAPTTGPAWTIDVVNGDRIVLSAFEAIIVAAVAGNPHLTVPMGSVHGLPIGLSFMGPQWSEARLLSLGYAFEQAFNKTNPEPFPDLDDDGLTRNAERWNSEAVERAKQRK